MKAKHVDTHGYITVSAINGTCRLNLTISYSGAKCTSSVKPSDPNYLSFKALWADKANVAILRKFMSAGFSALAPTGQEPTNGNGAKALKAMVESSENYSELLEKLAKALA